MTFPDVFTSTGNLVSALARNGDGVCPELLQEGVLVTVACSAIAVVYIVELLL